MIRSKDLVTWNPLDYIEIVEKNLLLLTGSSPSLEGDWGNCEPVINTKESTVWCRLSQHTIMSFTWCSVPQQHPNAKPKLSLKVITLTAPAGSSSERRRSLGQTWWHYYSNLCGEKRKKEKLGVARSLCSQFFFLFLSCQCQPYGVKATKTSIEGEKKVWAPEQ